MRAQHRLTRLSLLAACGAAALVVLSTACHDSTAPHPSSLNGQWVHGAIDASSQFSLERHSSIVTGSYTFSGIGGPIQTHEVRGTATATHLHLEWASGVELMTFDAPLPLANPNELVGRIAVDGFEPGPLTTFHRILPG